MIKRPSRGWQRKVTEQEAAVAAVTLPRNEAYATELCRSDVTIDRRPRR
jgi:hypothetical protein